MATFGSQSISLACWRGLRLTVSLLKCNRSEVVLGELEEGLATRYGSHSSMGTEWQDSEQVLGACYLENNRGASAV